MSLDATIYLYFPVSGTTAALQAAQKILARPRGSKMIKILAPDGESTAMPSVDEFLKKGKSYPLAEDSLSFETLIDTGSEDQEDKFVPVEMSLELGDEFLEIAFSSIASEHVDLWFSPPFRSRIAGLLGEGRGVAAAYESMGVWDLFAEPDKRLEVPDDRNRHEVGIDRFAGYLVDRLGADA